MSAQNIIELGFNVDELNEEKKQVLDIMVDLFGKLKEYDGTRFNPLGDGGLADLKKSITDGGQALTAFTEVAKKYNDVITQQATKNQSNTKATDALAQAMQQYQRIVDQLAATQAKNNALSSDAAEGHAVEKEALKQRNQELTAAARLQLAETGSINEAKAAVAQLTIERNNLNTTTEEGKARLSEINEEIDRNNQFLKENSAKLEQQKINIGNYAESMTPAFNGVKEYLGTINKQLAEMEIRGKAGFQNLSAAAGPLGFQRDRYAGNNSVTALASGSGSQVAILNQDAEAYQKLTVQQKILEQSLQRETIGFRNVTSEMRNVKNTLDALKIAGAGNTEAFEQLNVAYTGTEQKIKDLHREQAILTTDAPALTALTGVARGLGGAYAIGASGATLFADGNEKVEKELNKLIALMTFLQGLEEAVTTLKQRNAIVTSLEEEATKALNFVKQVETAIFGKSAAAFEADAAAKSLSTDATIANTGAVEENAASMAAATEISEGMTVATEAATAATISFETALVATGIGAIIVGLIYGITKLIGAISDWVTADERAEEAQKELAETLSKEIETFRQLDEVYSRIGKERIERLQREAQLSEDADKNQFIQLANERKVADARVALAQKEVDQKKINAQTIFDLDEKRKFSLETLQGYEESLAKAQRDYGEDDSKANKRRVEAFTKAVEQAEKDAKNASSLYQIVADALKELTDSQQAVEENRIKTARAAAEELAKLQADAAQRAFDIAQASNNRILSLDTSNEKQRLDAIAGNYNAEVDLAETQVTAIQKLIKDRTITEKEGADQIATIETGLTIKRQKALDDQLKVQIEFNDRMLDARNSIYKNDNESDAAKEDAVTKDNQKQLETRLQALNQYIDDKTSVIDNDYRTELAKAKEKYTTDEEYAALESDRQKQLLELTADVQKRIYDITISYGEARLKAIEEQNKATNGSNQVTEGYNKSELELNKHLGKNIFAFLAYNAQKKKLDEQYAIDKTAADIKDDQADLARLKDFLDNELRLKIAAANADLDAAKAGGNKDDVDKAQAKVDALKKIQINAAGDIASITKKLGDDISKNQDAIATSTLEKVQKTINTIKDVSMSVAQTMVGLFDAAKDSQIQSLEILTERQDAATEATIANVQRSTLSQREQAEELVILSTQKQARDSAAKKKEIQDKREEAVLDRDIAVANTIWNTEAAIAKTFSEYGFTPVGFALAAVGAALGAVEVATILAKPIPAYAEGIGIPGRGQHPGGAALIGEDGAERVTPKGGRSFVVDEATIMDLPAGSIVEPLNQGVIGELGNLGMMRGFAILNSHGRDDGGVERAINNQTSQIVRQLKKNQRHTVNVVNNIQISEDASTHIKIYGRRK